jgi:hypothetical protein
MKFFCFIQFLLNKYLFFSLLLLLNLVHSSCNRQKVDNKINLIINTLDNKLEVGEKTLLTIEIDKHVKLQNLDSILKTIDSLQIIWNENINNFRKSLSEKEINGIENSSRDRMRKIEKIILDSAPEYKSIFNN